MGQMCPERPDWVSYFVGLAFVASARSIDPTTKHGCVICDRNHRILSVGYNGYPRGMQDDSLPTNRPDPAKPDELSKYDFVSGTHSERNALFNISVSPWLLSAGAVAYVTGEPCNDCLTALWQSNVCTIYFAKRAGSALLNERTRRVRDIIVAQTGIELIEVEPDLSWLARPLQTAQACDLTKEKAAIPPQTYESIRP